MSVGLMFALVYNEVQWALKYLRFTQSVVILTLQVLQFSNAAGCMPKNTYLYTSAANIFWCVIEAKHIPAITIQCDMGHM